MLTVTDGRQLLQSDPTTPCADSAHCRSTTTMVGCPPPPTSLPHAPSTTTARPAGFPLGPTRLRRTPTSNPDRAEGPAELGKKLQSENCHTDLLVKNSGAGRGPTPKYTGKMEQSDSANDILRCTIMLQVLVGPASHTFVIHRCRTAAYELFHWFY
jgi:hypothetical protein